jgi:single-strand DNA-binding protein
MITVTVAGNVGKDAVLRSTQGGDSVLNFSVASSSYANGEKTTQWVDVSVWGKRAQALADLITKGSKVTAVGAGSLFEHNGKTYLKVRAFDVELQGNGQQQDRSERPARQAQQRAPAQQPPKDGFDEDDIPW